DLQSLGCDTPVPLIRSDSYTTLVDATNTRRGDIVEVINTTGPTLSGTDGLGDWNIPWDQWKAGNANL
ncbi:hypothetical protein ACAG25_23920, partial [Mycobacterium sp. pV006]